MKTTTESEYAVGVDLGDAMHMICFLDAVGEAVDRRGVTNHRESLRRLAGKYPGARLVLDVGSHSPWTSHQHEAQRADRTGPRDLREQAPDHSTRMRSDSSP